QVEVDGETITLFNTHLTSVGAPDSDAREDDPQAVQLADALAVVARYSGDGPTIFGGDFNTATTSSRASADVLNEGIEALGLEDAGAAAGTTSKYGFGSRIDYLLTTQFDTAAAYRMDAGTSDHAGVVVDLKLSTG
ncbi:MAG TPA: endonuclease/exonuclease/phosphatase family protein, partial [Luteimonas sp.]|nr:endonuclease/exonuclease/phosphatase family protein [Luteimonas sp.]